MNHIDIVLIAFVLLPGLLGAWRGMLWPIAVVFGIAGGAIAALIFGPPLAAIFLPEAPWAPLAGAAIVFVLVFSAVQGLRWLLRKTLAAVGLRWIDHAAGGLAAAAVGGIAGAWLVTAIGMVLPEKPPTYSSSLLADHAELVACGSGMPCDGEAPGRILEQARLPDVGAIRDSLPMKLDDSSDLLPAE